MSCTTAAHVLAAADQAKYRITPIGIDTNGAWSYADAAAMALTKGPGALPGRLDPTGSLVEPSQALTDVTRPVESSGPTVVLPLLHGPLGEDGTVQGMLELADIAYAGSGVLGSAVAMDKAIAKHILGGAGIAQADYRAFADHQRTPGLPTQLVAELGLPLFVKPANMGSSVGVTKAHDVDELRDAIELALTYDEWVIVEEGIDGREIEVAVLGNTEPVASVAGEIIPGEEFYSYTDKYVNDGSQGLIPAPLTESQMTEVRRLAVEVFTLLRCDGLARCDFFFEEHGRGFLCNEVNTMPGFTPISMFPKLMMASGMTYSEIIDRLVELAIERHARRRRNTAH